LAAAAGNRSVAGVNPNHDKLCGSPEWAAYIQDEVLPAVTARVDLGRDMLEIGPGPGAATGWLRQRVSRLTALERDEAAAAVLAGKYPGVEVTAGDATAMRFADCSFDSVGSFTMLHHVPTTALQNQILAEALRVLRPGGVLVGSDSLPSDGLHAFHEGDTCHPVEPATLLVRLQTLGYAAVMVAVEGDGEAGGVLMFTARKAGPADDGRR
jgi:SAM-dependent methyltransferase